MNMIKGLLHTQIMVPAGTLERARAFYCDVLGLEEVSKPEILIENDGFWLQVAHHQIYVGTMQGADDIVGQTSLVYEVVNIDDMRVRLKAYGLQLHDCPQGKYERFVCYDPFGNQLQFIMPLEAYTYC